MSEPPTVGEAGPLFAAPCQPASPSSRDGAAAARRQAPAQRMRILRVLAYADATREEICRAAGVSVNAACGRLAELASGDGPGRHCLLAGGPLVEICGRTPAHSGVRVNVYRITPAGRAALAAATSGVTPR